LAKGTLDQGAAGRNPAAVCRPHADLPWEHFWEREKREEDGGEDPAAAILALCRTAGIELWRQPRLGARGRARRRGSRLILQSYKTKNAASPDNLQRIKGIVHKKGEFLVSTVDLIIQQLLLLLCEHA
jgi:hypothetical protein